MPIVGGASPRSRDRRLRAQSTLGFAALVCGAGVFAADGRDQPSPLEAPTVEVVSDTPLPGLGVPRSQVPSNVQALRHEDIEQRQPLSLPEFLAERLPSVNIGEISGNPWQPDLNYRGFTASPLLGTPQGLSVYVDGMRINEPFGETVNWDLIAPNALSTLNLLPGANPVFGLNTLGGALSFRTKSGEHFPGLRAALQGGSFGRLQGSVDAGGGREALSWFIAGNAVHDDGWRDHSPSRLGQLFVKLGTQSTDADLDVSLALADNRLTGNQLTPAGLLAQRWESTYTQGDVTQNAAYALNATFSRILSQAFWLGGNVYRRETRTRQINPDVNQVIDPRFGVVPFEEGPNDLAEGGSGTNANSASLNRSRLDQTVTGATLQGTRLWDGGSQLTVGLALEHGLADYRRSYQLGRFGASREVIATDPGATELINLEGNTRTASLFATHAWPFAPDWVLTTSARANRTSVKTNDRLDPPVPGLSLDNDFTYRSFNPSVGIVHNPRDGLHWFASAGQGTRAPSPIELACADRLHPCQLPNAMQSDPFLDQVVTRTVEAGVRGGRADGLRWNLSLFRAENRDDILFVSAGSSQGYFSNFGRTRRQGVEADASGRLGRVDWSLAYTLVDATFRSPAIIVSPDNSSRGQAPGTAEDEILVSPGDRIPGIPRHQFKAALDWRTSDSFRLGADLVAYSRQFVRGNENNEHRRGGDFLGSGTAPGYAVVNLSAAYRPRPKGWEIFARVNNLFDRRYFTAGALAESAFPSGTFVPDTGRWLRETFYAPGTPRAVFVGVRYDG